MASIGKRLKKLRLSIKKTLDEQSKIFNVSLNTVYRWEHDLCGPRKSTLEKIAAFYNIPIEWLINGGESGNIDIASDADTDDNNKCDGCILNPDKNIDQEILMMLKKFSNNNKYKIIGYIERMYLEGER